MIPFTINTINKPLKQLIQKILINEKSVSSVIVENGKIIVNMNTGYSYINWHPTKDDFTYWHQYKNSSIKSKRWDMPAPDSLALAALNDFEYDSEPKVLASHPLGNHATLQTSELTSELPHVVGSKNPKLAVLNGSEHVIPPKKRDLE